jgi:hypothetical protein
MPVSPYAVASLIFEGVTVSGTLAQRAVPGAELYGDEAAQIRAVDPRGTGKDRTREQDAESHPPPEDAQ